MRAHDQRIRVAVTPSHRINDEQRAVTRQKKGTVRRGFFGAGALPPEISGYLRFSKKGFGLVVRARRKSPGKMPVLPIAELRIGLADAALLVGKSETHVLGLVRAGYIARAVRGQYLATAVAQGALRFREEEDRRSSKTAEQKRVQAARAREIELRNAREEGQLIEMTEVEAVFSDILGTFRSELAGVAAAATRDLAVRANIEQHLNAAVERCKQQFAGTAAKLRDGEQINTADDPD